MFGRDSCKVGQRGEGAQSSARGGGACHAAARHCLHRRLAAPQLTVRLDYYVMRLCLRRERRKVSWADGPA